MGLTSAVQWWEESQLRVLVLTSLIFQFLLFIFSSLRRCDIPTPVRFITWLAYLAGDAVAIYALATLFNRHKDGGGGSTAATTLEVVWAPILLLHLGGQDVISAYNIEDNELWARHLVTAVSQVTVAIYVFCRSWPAGGDRRLFQAAILLFVPGVLKCFHKAWALQRASFYSLANSLPAAAERWKDEEEGDEEEMMYLPLEGYVKRAKEFVTPPSVTIVRTTSGAASDDPSPQQDDDRRRRRRRRPPSREEAMRKRYEEEEQRKRMEERGEATAKIFIDLPSPYPRRLRILKHFWELGEDKAYGLVRGGLSTAFLLLYTKLKTLGVVTDADLMRRQRHQSTRTDCYDGLKNLCRQWIQLSRAVLPWAAIAAFHRHRSHREEASSYAHQAHHTDVKITYVLFCCTAMLEATSLIPVLLAVRPIFSRKKGPETPLMTRSCTEVWPERVAQCSLTGYFAHQKKKMVGMQAVAEFFGFSDFLDRYCCVNFCSTSSSITKLVLAYLKDGWESKIQDAATYRGFNGHSNHWVLERHCGGGSTNNKRPLDFDECVLLWHLATEFCFYSSSLVASCRRRSAEEAHRQEATNRSTEIMVGDDDDVVHVHGTSSSVDIETNRAAGSSSSSHLTVASKAVLCTQMSNYMAYLLFFNPEMLLPGSRRTLLKTAYKQLKHILNKDSSSNQKVQIADEQSIMKRVINIMRESSSNEEGSTTEKEPTMAGPKENFIREAWALYQRLLGLVGDEEKMWEEIEGVWVEMLCFSASRCRGYLHAKALAQGGEFLSYVWLLLFQMGMETFTDKAAEPAAAASNAKALGMEQQRQHAALHRHRHRCCVDFLGLHRHRLTDS